MLSFLKRLTALTIVSSICQACTSGTQPPSGAAVCAGCNVVLISLDTVRADHLGSYGYANPTSPNLDAFAQTAVVFEEPISQAAWTLPGHGSMFTGLYPGELGLARYPAARKIPPGAATLAERFRKAGYATAGFTGGGFVAGDWGFERGFDSYVSDGRRFEHNMQETLGWLALNRERRFFLFLHGYDAHRPYYSTAEDKRAVGLPDGIPAQRDGFCTRTKRERPSDLELQQLIGYYDAAIHHADRALQRVLDALDHLRLSKNTIVLITADHGEEFFEHGNCDHVRFLYKEIVHVPLLVRIPGIQPRRVAGIVPATVAVPNTLLTLTGVGPALPGPDLATIAAGAENGFKEVYSHTNSYLGRLGGRGESYAVTTQDRKLIAYPEQNQLEIYDRQRDPDERDPLPHDKMVDSAATALRGWRSALVTLPAEVFRRSSSRHAADGAAGDADAPALPSKEVEESLRSLGYVD